MYLVGASHPHKSDAQWLLEKMIRDRQRFVTDAEVLQEILHRYVSINRRDAIQPKFDVLLRVTDQVFSVDVESASRAKEIVMGHPHISVRDAKLGAAIKLCYCVFDGLVDLVRRCQLHSASVVAAALGGAFDCLKIGGRGVASANQARYNPCIHPCIPL